MDLVDLALNPRKARRRFSPFVSEMPEEFLGRLDLRFRERATADAAECAIYSRDAGDQPGALDRMLKRRAWAVVRPRMRGDLVDVLDFARSTNIPVVPRGGGTSRYGGASPTEGGLVVDMRGFDRVLAVDADAGTVTVEPGITWAALAQHLAADGLAPRQVPVELGATVGGTIAQGGGGIGSLAYGPYRSSVVEAVLLAPSGDTLTLQGDDLDLVDGTWGITGFLVQVTLRVRQAAAETLFLATFDGHADAGAAASRIAREVPDAYHLAVYSKNYATQVNDASGETMPGKSRLPRAKWSVLVVLHDASDRSLDLSKAILQSGGKLETDVNAARAWGDRHELYLNKRLGPSLSVTESWVPTEELSNALVGVAAAVNLEGIAQVAMPLDHDRMLLTLMVLHDERRSSFALTLAHGRAQLRVARRHGGGVYRTGVTQAKAAREVLGRSRLRVLKKFKSAHDPSDIQNPGPVLGARIRGVPFPRLFNTFITSTSPVLRATRGADPYDPTRNQDPSWGAYQAALGSARGGPLARVADVVQGADLSGSEDLAAPEAASARWASELPSGRILLAREILAGRAPLTERVQRNVARAPLGHAAEAASTSHVPLEEVTDLLLAAFDERFGALPEHQVLARNAERTGNVFGRPAADRLAWAQAGFPFANDARALLLPDDIAALEAPQVATLATRALLNAGLRLSFLGAKDATSGAPLFETGQRDAAGEILADLLAAVADRRVETVVSPDANAVRAVRVHWPELLGKEGLPSAIEAKHAAVALQEALASGALELQDEADLGIEGPVALHLPEGLEAEEHEAIRALLDAIPGVEVVDVPHHDCGHGRGLRETYPDLHGEIATACAEAVKAAGASVVVTASPGCFVTLKAATKDLEVRSLYELVSSTMVEREGGSAIPAGAVSFEEEEQAFVEHDIPEGKFRLEFVNEKVAIPVGPDEKILETAEDFGLELPFSCRAGNCDTCCARYEGTAPDQSLAEAIDEDEQKSFVLCCISKPTGPMKIWSNESPNR